MKLKSISALVVFLLCAIAAIAQVSTTSPLDGSIVDPQGAAVVGAAVEVINIQNGQNFKTTTDERGHWVIPAIASGTYKVNVAAKGFRTLTLDGIKIDTGVAATVNSKLEVGQLSETVEVNAGAEMVQTANATVNTTIQGRQIFELPFTSRNALELLVSQPGTLTTSTARNSLINGLPYSGINVTVDGINTQDNYYKSGDGFFTLIPVRTDSMEEVTLTTAAAGADSLAQGAATVKFITKSGTNTFHGGAFWQHRNTALDANYYFNNINGVPRDRLILNQGGVNLGGPIKKDKLFFFNNYEIFRYPAQTSATRQVMTPDAINGNYTYMDSSKVLRTVNVLNLAGAAGYVNTPDPIIQNTLNTINGLTKNGVLQSRIPTNTDYNRNNLIFQPSGLTKNWYNTSKVDYNINQSNQFSLVYTYYANDSTPDITNNVVSIFPGTGTILGNPSVAGQGGNRYAGTVSLRSTITPQLTNEFRAGMNRSITLFRSLVSSPTLFDQWRGYSPTLGFGLTNVASVSGSSRRESPVKEIHDDISYVKGTHLMNFGGSFTQVNFWMQTLGTNVIPTISFNGLSTLDPIGNGSTNIFTTTNLPGASSTNLTEAGQLYATLTGRVASITRSQSLNGSTHQYDNVPTTDKDRQREWGIYFQDTWKATRDLTLSFGLRFDQQRPFENLDNTYSYVSSASTWGVSGIGNLFQPGYMPGVNPVFEPWRGAYDVPNSWNPTIGLAWQTPGVSGPLGWLLGHEKGKTVLRAGYGIATLREGSYTFQTTYGLNVGLTQSASVDPSNYPSNFGPAGSVLFRNPTLPTRPVPSGPAYPITPGFTDSLNAIDPNLKMGYVQSWNLELQRQFARDMVLDVRYTGNHGVGEWRQININGETNIFENGFLKEFQVAQNNLKIAQAISPNSTNYGNQGLAGQGNIPIILTAIGSGSDTTTATQIRQNQADAVARGISTNATRLGKLTAAGYPANFFVPNPAVGSGGSYVIKNLGSSMYDALQIEVRKRMTSGLLVQGSYVWSKSLVNGASTDLGDFSQPTTLRNLGLDKGYSPSDVRHGFKANWIYELPIGPGHHFLNGNNPIMSRLLGGWQISGISRVQSGQPFYLTSGRRGLSDGDNGVVLNNITLSELQDQVKIRKSTASNGVGVVYWLPQSIIDNTNAAFELNSKTLDPTKPYIGTQTGANFGYRIALRYPWQYHLDLSLLKRTTIRDRANVEFRANFLDALNLTNFNLANQPSSTAFGQTTSAFRDFSGTNDTGARMIEFMLRVNF